jgi:hypothetical protein
MSDWTVAWLLWILQFIAIEGQALLNKTPGDTLTEHVHKWFSLETKGFGWRARRASLIAFLSWLTLHFLFPGQF